VANNNLYEKQNVFLKLFFVLSCLIYISIGNFIHLSLIFILIVIFLAFQPEIFIFWLKTISKLSFFFISYFIFSTIFKIDFFVQLKMFIKIVIMLLLSVYLVRTSSTKFLFFGNLPPNSLKYDFVYFILATMNFINIFYNNYLSFSSKKYPLKKMISKTLKNSISEVENIKIKIEKDLNTNNNRTTFFSFENLYLLFFVTLLSILSVL
jgi:hypothetical protein